MFIADAKGNVPCRQRGEENGHVVAIADVLRALADVERDLRRPLSAVAAEDLENDVLHAKAREPRRHRPLVVDGNARPPIAGVARRQGGLRLGRAVRGDEHVSAVRAVDAQRSGDLGLVEHLHQKQPRAPFHELRLRRPLVDADATLRIDADNREHVLVQSRLNLLGRLRFDPGGDGGVQRLPILRRERLSQIAERGFDASGLLRERLQVHGRLRHLLRTQP